MPSALTASGSASGSTYGQDTSPVDDANISEEKRRRNTAASARFRVKKKQKALNLERTVSDLTGRVDELEQEAADLRRENGWLKEIVMLKSTRTVGGPSAGPSNSAKDDEKDDEADEGVDGGEEDKPKEK
ncbi:hypothetical protein BV25DRAFT_1794574 [Artomyces pyxidatus]|uniref:Uncharacterized protein n=1 Tax=Artomyces pyxidatus TaxID=48021 RepID=A0ACB8THN4_9AGAM|nr:hypothetical protein BV25DRAFT_1794574 [Artomyces pyxidatus]